MKKIILKKPDGTIAISHFQHEFDEAKEKELIIASVASFIFDFHNKELGNQISSLISQANHIDIYFKTEIDDMLAKKQIEINKLPLPDTTLDIESEEFKAQSKIYEDEVLNIKRRFLTKIQDFKEKKYNDLINEAESLLLSDIYEVVENLELPEDKYFRNAWTFENGEIKISPEKKLDVIRQKRKFKLGQLDKEELAETFNPRGDVTPIREKKQILRDITKSDLSDEEIKQLLK